jgi:hypothetical protein
VRIRAEIKQQWAENGFVESERAFVEDRKERESFTAVDGCDVLQAGRPLRLELESTNER